MTLYSGSVPGLERARHWRDEAACRSVDPDMFFTDNAQLVQQAKKVCRGCPVWEECRQYALAHGEWWGVWGGMTQTQLRTNTNRRRQPQRDAEAKPPKQPPSNPEPATCGTSTGVQQHRKNGEDPCTACQAVLDAAVERRTQQAAKKWQPAKCGTRGGYQKHLREKTEICAPCRRANADSDNRLRRTGTTKPPAKRPETLAEAFEWRTVRTEEGHVLWYGDKQIKFQNSKHSALRVAFKVGHGRDPEGPIRRTCGKDCYAADHLTDAVMRDTQTVCGTSAGYVRHVRRGEETCEQCRAANAAQKARYQRTGTTKTLAA